MEFPVNIWDFQIMTYIYMEEKGTPSKKLSFPDSAKFYHVNKWIFHVKNYHSHIYPYFTSTHSRFRTYAQFDTTSPAEPPPANSSHLCHKLPSGSCQILAGLAENRRKASIKKVFRINTCLFHIWSRNGRYGNNWLPLTNNSDKGRIID